VEARRGDAAGVSVEHARLWVQGRRFRIDWVASAGSTVPLRSEMYDARNPGLVWSYDPKGRRALPTLETLTAAVASRARALGPAEARRQLGIPPAVPLTGSAPTAPRPSLGPVLLDDIEAPPWRRVAGATWQGAAADVFRAIVNAAPVPSRPAGGTIEARPRQTLTATVHREWGVVVRFEHAIEFTRPPRLPNQRRVYEVTSAHLRPPPKPGFDLPAGTTAELPRTFAGAKLAPGVIRAAMTGPFAATGIDYGQYAGPAP